MRSCRKIGCWKWIGSVRGETPSIRNITGCARHRFGSSGCAPSTWSGDETERVNDFETVRTNPSSRPFMGLPPWPHYFPLAPPGHRTTIWRPGTGPIAFRRRASLLAWPFTNFCRGRGHGSHRSRRNADINYTMTSLAVTFELPERRSQGVARTVHAIDATHAALIRWPRR
jgi:hypothetical protein